MYNDGGLCLMLPVSIVFFSFLFLNYFTISAVSYSSPRIST